MKDSKTPINMDHENINLTVEEQVAVVKNNIKKLLKARGLTLVALADHIGYTRQGLSYSLLNHYPDIKLSLVMKSADFLGVHITTLFSEEINNPFESKDMHFVSRGELKHELEKLENEIIQQLTK